MSAAAGSLRVDGLRFSRGGAASACVQITAPWPDARWDVRDDDEARLAASHIARALPCAGLVVAILRAGPAPAPAASSRLEIAAPPPAASFFRAVLRLEEGSTWYVSGPDDLAIGEAGQTGHLERLPGSPIRIWRLPHTVGESALVWAGMRVPILVLDRKMTFDGGDPVRAVDALLLDVWERHVALLRSLGRPSSALADAGRRWRRTPVQTLMLLDRLLWAEGVAEAWEAIASEPHEALAIERPACELARARRPILDGARGPWSLPGGLDEDRRILRVRDRRPVRTADTPPNRLAVRLAQTVDDVAATAAASLRGESGGGAAAWRERARAVRRRATAFRAHPALAGVDPWGAVALDSPAVHLAPLYRPILRAWMALQEGTDFPREAEALFRDPLKEAFALYEYWCWFRLGEAVERAAGQKGRVARLPSPTTTAGGDACLREGLVRDVRLSGTGRTARLWYNQTATRTSGNAAFHSYSIGGWRPDVALGLFEEERLVDFVVFDAKYRVKLWEEQNEDGPRRHGAEQVDDLKVMHAYRDALRWGRPARPPRWVIALYPGTEAHLFATDGRQARKDDATHRLADPASEGVGALPAAPTPREGAALARDADAARLDDAVAALLRRGEAAPTVEWGAEAAVPGARLAVARLVDAPLTPLPPSC